MLLYLLCAALLLPAAGIGRVTDTVMASSAGARSIKLNKTIVQIKTGEAFLLKVENTARSARWALSNNKTVRIKAYGKRTVIVYGKTAGSVVVTATVGGKRLRCIIKVADAARLAAISRSWTGGTWRDGRYYNGAGVAQVNIQAVMKQPVRNIKSLKKYPYLYIGASRTKNTAKAVKDKKVYFYYCGGAGFRWFFYSMIKDGKVVMPALQMIRSYLKQRPAGTVIIDLGGNDLSNIEAYIGLYSSLKTYYPLAKFRFMGVLPRAKGDSSNPARAKFNLRLAAALHGQVINLYNWVYHMSGFKTVDGTHYGKVMSRKIYRMTMKLLGRPIRISLSSGKVTG